ncbi:type VI secretion system baseplate subunit TssK [Pseudomonas fluorescens]|uniref:type VI secretion system baseplate subunit TssK n=1 Tax=Pseudomonas fluorescens TaxID=294 RepID=UPI00192A8D86|nr:type VI secretion system baseplate subunit TssK [Pseudomonas fluorescens]MBL4981615.1 type VI secretion system baseplate subunit TssK [Pseudomonas fluorescens]
MINQPKVVWSEGMFLQPQHFQQHERYIQAQLVQALRALQVDAWGFTALKIDKGQLALGSIVLTECAGVLPDGSFFVLGDDELALLRYTVVEGERDQPVVLALALQRRHGVDTETAPSADSLARYRVVEACVPDSNVQGSEVATLQLGQLNMKLAREQDVVVSHVFLPVARVLERSPGGQVLLDEEFIAPVMAWRRSPKLAEFVDDIIGRVRQRAFTLAANLGVQGLGGVSEVQDFLMLQTLNRAQPLLVQLASREGLHPEQLYRSLVTLAGDLAIFVEENKRPKQYPIYRHDQLADCFTPVIQDLRHALSAEAGSDVVPLALSDRELGVRFASVPDSQLYRSARFVLAVRAQLPDDELRKRFPHNLKIGPIECMRDLVDLQLPGLKVHVLPAAPRELPYYAGFSYFELESEHPLWAGLSSSAGFGLHLAGDFPGLQLAFWAIKAGQ